MSASSSLSSSSSYGPSSASMPTEHDYEVEFTPRAFTMAYSPAAGWHKPQLLPLEQFALHPGTAGLHNGQIAIEGLRAYRRIDSTIAAFRPWEHARRFRASARRAAMPALPDDLFVSAIDELVEADAGSLDEAPGSSLYLRSLMFAADLSLGQGSSRHYGFVLMAQSASRVAEHNSTDPLDGPSVFLVRATRPRAEVILLAPEDSASPGVLAESVLTLASRLGYIVRQQRATLDERGKGSRQGATETFTCSTLGGVVPLGGGDSQSERQGEPGPVTDAIRRALLDIQSGREPGPRGWMYQIPSADTS